MFFTVQSIHAKHRHTFPQRLPMDPPCHWRVVAGTSRRLAPRRGGPALAPASPTRARAHKLDHFSVDRRSRVAPRCGAAVPRPAWHRCHRGLRRASARLAVIFLTAATLLAGAVLTFVVVHIITD